MSTPQWDDLIEQLQDPDPNVRRKACQRLAATNDPTVLPYLRNAYLQEDDERVRRAARDALAAFKTAQIGEVPARSFPISDRILSRSLAGLAILFVLSLVLNGLVIVLGSETDEADHDDIQPVVEVRPTEWAVLTNRMQTLITQARDDAASIRLGVNQYNQAGTVGCAESYNRPTSLMMPEIDVQTYRDLAVIGINLDVTLFTLRQVQTIWDHVCRINIVQMAEILEVSTKLDQVEVELAALQESLHQAILNPAPTVGPTITPTPTLTDTPEPTLTPLPGTATEVPAATASPGQTEPPAIIPTITPANTPTITRTPTHTPIPTATLPFPDLDYPAIVRDLSRRFDIMGDLENPYQKGLLDYWQRAQRGEQVPTSVCTLREWPPRFEWTDAQLARLQMPGVADPQLEEAVLLINQGVDLAYQARALFEATCPTQSLAGSATQGIALADNALSKLDQAQVLVDAIRRR